MAEQGATTDALLGSILLAQTVNRVCLTHYAPWDIEQIDDVWLDAIKALAFDMPHIQSGIAKVAAIQDRFRIEFRKRNPGYLH